MDENIAEQEPRVQKILLLPGDRYDGNVSVTFGQDNLSAEADFYPPKNGGLPLRANQIVEALAHYGIVHGVLFDVIEEAVTACNLNHMPGMGLTIARGNPPVSEILEYFEMNPALKTSAPPAPPGNSRLDYKAFSPFVIVKKGQALARRRPRKEGRDGKDILGTVITHGTVKPEGVSGGENTHSDEKFIYSSINGQMVKEGAVLRVQDNLVIKGPVDYRTGNIVFPGDVEIDGPVSDGFKIYSGGSVSIKQTFDVTDAITKNDLTVSGGIIGRGRALVKVGGALNTKFIENCKVAARKSVSVDSDIINSSVYTMEKVVMSEKGFILGSEIYAVRGVSAGGIGKKSGKTTHIHCGVDFTAQQDKEKANNQLRLISAKLSKIRELIALEQQASGASAEKTERMVKMEEVQSRLEGEQKKTTERVAAILGRLNSDDQAVVEVQGEIAPGTLIEICQVALFISEPLKHVRIKLDRGLGKLITENL